MKITIQSWEVIKPNDREYGVWRKLAQQEVMGVKWDNGELYALYILGENA